MNKWFKAFMWLFILLAFGAVFIKRFVDYLVDPTTGIMVVGAMASWFPEYLVAFVGIIPWIWPIGVIIGIIIMLARPDKPNNNIRGF